MTPQDTVIFRIFCFVLISAVIAAIALFGVAIWFARQAVKVETEKASQEPKKNKRQRGGRE